MISSAHDPRRRRPDSPSCEATLLRKAATLSFAAHTLALAWILLGTFAERPCATARTRHLLAERPLVTIQAAAPIALGHPATERAGGPSLATTPSGPDETDGRALGAAAQARPEEPSGPPVERATSPPDDANDEPRVAPPAEPEPASPRRHPRRAPTPDTPPEAVPDPAPPEPADPREDPTPLPMAPELDESERAKSLEVADSSVADPTPEPSPDDATDPSSAESSPEDVADRSERHAAADPSGGDGTPGDGAQADETGEGDGTGRVAAAAGGEGMRNAASPRGEAAGSSDSAAELRAARLAWFEAIHPTLERATRTTPRMRRQGLVGTVVLELRLDADGHLLEVRVHRSSGRGALDEHAVQQILSVGRLAPPPALLGEAGRRVRVPVEFG